MPAQSALQVHNTDLEKRHQDRRTDLDTCWRSATRTPICEGEPLGSRNASWKAVWQLVEHAPGATIQALLHFKPKFQSAFSLPKRFALPAIIALAALPVLQDPLNTACAFDYTPSLMDLRYDPRVMVTAFSQARVANNRLAIIGLAYRCGPIRGISFQQPLIGAFPFGGRCIHYIEVHFKHL